MFNKIANKLKHINQYFYLYGRVSLKTWLISYMGALLNHLKCYRTEKRIRDSVTLNHLNKVLEPIVKKYKYALQPNSVSDSNNKNGNIWVCWWQGRASAPKIINACINSIYKYSNCHKVVLITKYNYFNYINIPCHILSQLETNKICFTNFADYLRMALLKKYGGLWIDASVLLTKKIPQWYFDKPIMTLKNQKPFLLNGYYSAFFIGGNKNNLLFQFVEEAIKYYTKKRRGFCSYYMIDYIIHIAYTNLKQVSEQIDAIPVTNIHFDELRKALICNKPISFKDKAFYNDTLINKLSWKANYKLEANNGEISLYSYIIN